MILTSNYALKKPEGTDVVNVDDFNANADIIDSKLKELETNEIYYAVATGSANTYAITVSAIKSLFDGLAVCVKINVASTGSSTININGWGAKSILDSLGNPITNGGLKKDVPYTLRYNGVNFILQGKGGGGNVTADKLLIGTTATGDSGAIVGIMPNNGALSITPGTTTKNIPLGYTSGGTVAGDSNLITGNIKAGVSIFGVTGKSSVVDTSDALATASQLLAGASAYVNGLKVLGSIQSKSATTYNPSTTAQTIAQGLYLSGDQTIAPVTGTSNVGHVLAGYTFSSANGINLTGNIPSKGATTITPGTTNQVVSANQYLSGAITVLGDPDLISSNIVDTTNVFGVQGTANIQSLGGAYISAGNFVATAQTTAVNIGFQPSRVFIYNDLIGDAPTIKLIMNDNGSRMFLQRVSDGHYYRWLGSSSTQANISFTATGFSVYHSWYTTDTQTYKYIAIA
ncbi:hypothetical protein ACN077_20680 [Clostridium chromiireducens]|uniref:hypothetical protein n=1 Tax=Clostridium chromiireducens TaxID=225345 RepID=UPI003AF5A0D8